MPKRKKPAAKRAAKVPRLTKAQERDILLEALLEAGDFDLATEIIYEELSSSRGKKQRTRSTRPKTFTRKGPPPQRKVSEKTLARVKRDRAVRAAETRKTPHRRITSKSSRSTVARVRYKEFGWEFGDIVGGRKEAGAKGERVRAQFDAQSAPYIGRDVQISYHCIAKVHGARVGTVRVRMLARNFQGRADIARLSQHAIREAMVTLGSEGAVYITSVSLQVIA